MWRKSHLTPRKKKQEAQCRQPTGKPSSKLVKLSGRNNTHTLLISVFTRFYLFPGTERKHRFCYLLCLNLNGGLLLNWGVPSPWHITLTTTLTTNKPVGNSIWPKSLSSCKAQLDLLIESEAQGNQVIAHHGPLLWAARTIRTTHSLCQGHHTHTHTHTHTLSLSQTHLTEDNDLLSGGGFLFFFVSLALTKWGKTLPGGGRAYFWLLEKEKAGIVVTTIRSSSKAYFAHQPSLPSVLHPCMFL